MSERTFPAQDAPPGEERRHSPNVTLTVILACQLLVGIDFTIVNIALPQMQAGLGFSATGLAWVFDSYALTFGGLLLLGGRAGDIFGRRRTTSSAECGLDEQGDVPDLSCGAAVGGRPAPGTNGKWRLIGQAAELRRLSGYHAP